MKSPLIAVVMLSVGFALGWAFKPNDSTQTAAPEAQTASASRASILDSSTLMAEGPSDGKDSKLGAVSGAPKDGNALLDLFALDGNMRDQLVGYQKLSCVSETQVRDLAVSLAKAPKNDTRLWQARNALFNRWAEIAPEALFAFAKDARDRQNRQQGVNAACQALAKQDLSKVRELLEAVSDRELRQNMLYPIVSAGAAKDPEAMLTFLSGEKSESAEGAYHHLFQAWAPCSERRQPG
jgi:hypothetical protein